MIASLDVPQIDPNIKPALKAWARELGFQQLGVTDVDLSAYEPRFKEWLDLKFHGDMAYMETHGSKRYRPAELIPGTVRVLSVRMDYLPEDEDGVEMPEGEWVRKHSTLKTALSTLSDPNKAYVARYALGRDYHKVIRKRLTQLAERISGHFGPFGYRAFADSAPVLEKPLAEKSGLGWIGKHTNLINKQEGSWFFIGEIYTDLPVEIDQPATNHCGSCVACLDVCPTQAIVAPYKLDARRCIAYLTIEYRGSIPLEFRELIGNRVFGCDDCQLFCPWNSFATSSKVDDFKPRHGLESEELVVLFGWTEKEFLDKTAGSPIRRIGYECWLRNLAIGLGNAPKSTKIVEALKMRAGDNSELVREHVSWALTRQRCSLDETKRHPGY